MERTCTRVRGAGGTRARALPAFAARLALFAGALAFATASVAAPAVLEFRVRPYPQAVTGDGVTILWAADGEGAERPGEVVARRDRPGAPDPPVIRVESASRAAEELAYAPGEPADGRLGAVPWLHRARVEGLEPGERYRIEVVHRGARAEVRVRTAPPTSDAVRFVVFADSETAPGSVGNRARWPASGAPDRRYPVDQTDGFAANLSAMSEASPDFVVIPGDLVEAGNEQRDWDEFWRHLAGTPSGLATRAPLIAAIGNHDVWSGPSAGYDAAATRASIARFQAWFEPTPGALGDRAARFHRFDFGPATILTLDSSNGLPDGSDGDSNHYLDGPASGAPDFHPGSAQHEWLARELDDCARSGRATFVQFHHSPWSVGPHGAPPSDDPLSGRPLRVLHDLFARHGVVAVFCGHDEMYERSIVDGVHYYDVGIGGDGLRAPVVLGDAAREWNPYQVFLPDRDEPERWEGSPGSSRLLGGGRHYGHLVVEVAPLTGETGAPQGTGAVRGLGDAAGSGAARSGERSAPGWRCELVPVYVLPRLDEDGAWTGGFERREYADRVIVSRPR